MQKHNEEKLNKAYDTCGAVYLIFSVNGRGSFQGWARMTSKITHGQVKFGNSFKCPNRVAVLASDLANDSQ